LEPLNNIEQLKEQIAQLLFRLLQLLSLVDDLERDHETIREMEKKRDIPPEYEQRFSLEPLQAPDQVKGRNKALEKLNEAHKSHLPLLVEGEPGCGMTSFLNAALARFENVCIIADDGRIHHSEQLIEILAQNLDMDIPPQVDAFLTALPEEPKWVIIFENVERLFLRRINGFDLVETFLVLIQRTEGKIFWIVTCNRYPLEYLSHVLPFREQFPNRMLLHHFDKEEAEKETGKAPEHTSKDNRSFKFSLPFFRASTRKRTENEAEQEAEKHKYDRHFIEQILESLNHDYQNKFFKPTPLPSKLERDLTRAKDDEERMQKLLRDHFFEKMHQFANGHISRALLFWLHSVVGVREGDKEKPPIVWLKPFEPKSPASIKRPEEWFALEAIFQHNSLNIDELSQVIRHPRNQCRLIIHKLLNDEWIFKRKLRNGQQEYQINLLYTIELQGLLKNELTRKFK
jgi:hypothetical protein